ncbi:MAG: oxaloacetate decarboxylase [Deltaproteobacteria bacterium]|nr:oxaloacetate decarboxylase [Deltaproteobacteria bacterium]
MKKTSLFKNYILDDEILIMPGVPDALTAIIAQNAGFKCITRGGASGLHILGKPDLDLATLTELTDWTEKIVDAVDIPVFADGDTGHGNVTNVVRTVQLFERAGAAGLFIEDQVSPKRCGHTAGKQIISAEDMAAKLKAAVDARKDPDFVISARIDAIAVEGINGAIDRGNIYHEAGADLIFVEAPESVEQMRKITTEIDAPHMANIILGAKTPILTPQQLQEIGYSVAAYPAVSSCIIVKALKDFFEEFHRTLDYESFSDRMMNFYDFFNLAGLDKYRDAEERYTEQGREVVKNHKKLL